MFEQKNLSNQESVINENLAPLRHEMGDELLNFSSPKTKDKYQNQCTSYDSKSFVGEIIVEEQILNEKDDFMEKGGMDTSICHKRRKNNMFHCDSPHENDVKEEEEEQKKMVENYIDTYSINQSFNNREIENQEEDVDDDDGDNNIDNRWYNDEDYLKFDVVEKSDQMSTQKCHLIRSRINFERPLSKMCDRRQKLTIDESLKKVLRNHGELYLHDKKLAELGVVAMNLNKNVLVTLEVVEPRKIKYSIHCLLCDSTQHTEVIQTNTYDSKTDFLETFLNRFECHKCSGKKLSLLCGISVGILGLLYYYCILGIS